MKFANINYALRELGNQRGLVISDVKQRPDGSVTFAWSREGGGRLDGESIAACGDNNRALVDMVEQVLDLVVGESCRS